MQPLAQAPPQREQRCIISNGVKYQLAKKKNLAPSSLLDCQVSIQFPSSEKALSNNNLFLLRLIHY